MRVRTSHVGSFPLKHDLRLVPQVLTDLKRVGVDVPPYPQMRSFVDIYLDPLADKGLLVKKGDLFFSKEEELRKADPPKARVPEAEEAIKALRELGLSFEGLRGPVTGPFTLASRVYLTVNIEEGLRGTALARKELLQNFFIPYVRSAVEELERLGYTHLFIDEPVLGVIVGRRRILFGYSGEDITSAVEGVFERSQNAQHGIHVCGTISGNLLNILAGVEVLNILNFEFHDSRPNLKILDAEVLEAGGKVLAPGVASSRNPSVEGVDEIASLLREVAEKVSWRVDLVSADCGFGGLGADESGEMYSVALRKLRNIALAVKKVFGED